MLSERIKTFRKQRDLSQQKLSEKIGLSFNAITKIEQGLAKHHTLKTLMKLADVFEISIDVLV